MSFLQPPNSSARLLRHSSRYEVSDLLQAVHKLDAAQSEELTRAHAEMDALKKEISALSKTNFTVAADVREIDLKISLLIRNRISLEAVMALARNARNTNSRAAEDDVRLPAERRALYGRLFYLLQRDTRYLAALALNVTLAEIDELLQTVLFTLFGNQYERAEEHVLLTFFREVLVVEFERGAPLGIGSTMRSNTAITRMLTTYTRRGPGQSYLKTVLVDVLGRILADTASLEIQPSKVYAELHASDAQPPARVDDDTAAADEAVQALIAPRLERLRAFARDLLDTLIASADDVPYGIRWLCKSIRALVRTTFPTATREQTCSLIGGFFLLRYVNPAIVSPQAFMLVETKLSAASRRNLTLLAKLLQNLANNVRFGASKEAYMAPLNDVLDAYHEHINGFLESLTQVEDLEERLSMDEVLAMGRTTAPTSATDDADAEGAIRITFNEIAAMHKLCVDYAAPLEATPSSEPMRALLKALRDAGEPPSRLPRAENVAYELALRRPPDDAAAAATTTTTATTATTTTADASTAAAAEPRPELRYTEAKRELFAVVRALPLAATLANAAACASLTTLLAHAAAHAQVPDAAARVDRLRAAIAACLRAKLLSMDDDNARLRHDVVVIAQQFAEQLARAAADVALLRGVLQDVREQNHFLLQQLAAYQDYLDNVRTQSQAKAGAKGRDGGSGGVTAQLRRLRETISNVGLGSGGGGGGDGGDAEDETTLTHAHAATRDGIIVEAQLPRDRLPQIAYCFSSPSPGVLDVAVLYRGRQISVCSVKLDDLLVKRDGRHKTDLLTLDNAKTIAFFNKHFG